MNSSQEGFHASLRVRAAALVLLAVLAGCSSSPGETTVFLVRHAEKQSSSDSDPALSQNGEARAMLLARMLNRAGIQAVYATEFLRTQQTVAPLADSLGLSTSIVPAANTAELCSLLRTQHAGQTVLVAGHSNTLPEIIRGLGGEAIPEIAETEYDHLFVLLLRAEETRLIHLQFGGPLSPD